jgi:hypothetical protein
MGLRDGVYMVVRKKIPNFVELRTPAIQTTASDFTDSKK